MNMGIWDAALIAGVSIQCTIIAYLHAPKWKALVLGVPLPFTIATLALGQPINTTHACGLFLLLLFSYGVQWLHYGLRAPIIAAIAIAALTYGLLGSGLAAVLPRTGPAFWTTLAAALTVALALFLLVPHREEPGHRTDPAALEETAADCGRRRLSYCHQGFAPGLHGGLPHGGRGHSL